MNMPPPIQTAFTKLLGIEYPIIAAPMFLISDAKLVSAACAAGGTGAFPALNFRPVERFREEVQTLKSMTNKPFGVNLIVQKSNKYYEEQLQVCLEEKVAYIITSLGNPNQVIRRAHEKGLKVFCDVVNRVHAKKAVEAGADALIAVGSGAGGHAGDISPFALIPSLKAEFGVPIIAAGSIGDGETMLAALSLGASAVYIGTRLIASTQSNAPQPYKQAIVEASAEDIISTDRVDGFAGNFIRTKDFNNYVPDPGVVEKLLATSKKFRRWQSLYKAGRQLFGDPNKLKASYKTVFSAGHGVGAIHSVKSVGEILSTMVSGYHKAKQTLP